MDTPESGIKKAPTTEHAEHRETLKATAFLRALGVRG